MQIRGRGLSITLAASGIGALVITMLMNRHAGESMGATSEGRALLSAGAIAVDVVGICVMGMVAGALISKRGAWLKILGGLFGLVMIGSVGLSIMSIMNFVAAERMSVDRARKAQEQAVEQRREDQRKAAEARQRAAELAAKEQRDTQARLAESHLKWQQRQIEGAGRKERRELRKETQAGAAEIIAKVGQAAPAPAAPEPTAPLEPPVVIVRSEYGVEMIAEMSGLDARTVIVTQMGWLAVLLILYKALAFPGSAILWAKASDEAEIFRPLPAPARIDPPVTIDMAALPPPSQDAAADDGNPPTPPVPAEIPPAAEAAPPPPAEPEKPAQPVVRTLLDGADQSLRAIGFPVDGPPVGPLRSRDDPKTTARRFVVWVRAYGRDGDMHEDEIVRLYAEFAREDHREQIAPSYLLNSLRDHTPGVRKHRPRVGGVKVSRWVYTIAPGRFPKPKAAPSGNNPPRATSEVTEQEHPDEAGRVVRPPAFFRELEGNQAMRRMLAHEARRVVKHRKQRGAMRRVA